MQMMDLVPDLRPVILAAREFADDRNSLAQFLPNTPVQAISYRLGRRKRVDQSVPIRAFDAPAIPIRRPGVVEVRGDLPAITPIVDLTETDLNNEWILAQQLAGAQVDWQPWVSAAAGLAAATIDNTLEIMRGQLLSTGKISIQAEDDVVHEVDFEIPAEQKIAAAGGSFFENIEAAHEVFRDASGDDAAIALTSSKMLSRALQALQALFPMAPVGQTNLNAYLADRRLPQFVVNNRRLHDEAGNRVRVYPEDCLTFLPSGDAIGRTELGVTQEAIQQVQGQVLAASEAPGVTVVTLGEDNPVQRAVKAAAIGLPIISDNHDIVIVTGLLATTDGGKTGTDDGE